MFFILQSLSAQSNCAHMQLLHEAVDTTKCWEKSPPSTPLLYITIPVRIIRSLVRDDLCLSVWTNVLV